MSETKSCGFINLWHSYATSGSLVTCGKIFDTFAEADEAIGADRYGFFGTFKIERVENRDD